MTRLLEKFFARFGLTARLSGSQGSIFLPVVWQPDRGKALQQTRKLFGPVGRIPRGQHVCYFLAGAPVRVEDRLTLAGQDYRICRVEKMYLCGKSLYLWALCCPEGGEVL